MSTMDDREHFGLGSVKRVDSLEVIWPDGRYQLLTGLDVDRLLVVKQSDATEMKRTDSPLTRNQIFQPLAPRGLTYKHQAATFVDYSVQPLLPYMLSRQGPPIAVGDVNGDGLDDVFIGGGVTAVVPAALWAQSSPGVELATEAELRSVVEEVTRGGRIGVPPGLPESWRPANVTEDHGLDAHELDGLDGVLTGCTVAIAETGTLVLAGGALEGRRALTLVPDLHVCVVRTDQVVETVPEAFASLRGLERRPLTFVSGPSATSDIELQRVEGVHGPRSLVVVILRSGV